MDSTDEYSTFSEGPGDKRPAPSDSDMGSNWSDGSDQPLGKKKQMRKKAPRDGSTLWRTFRGAAGLLSNYDPDTVTWHQLNDAVKRLEPVIQGGAEHNNMMGYLQGRTEHLEGTEAGTEWESRHEIADGHPNNEQFADLVGPAVKALNDLAGKHDARVDAAKGKSYSPSGAVYGATAMLANSPMRLLGHLTMAQLEQTMFRPCVIRRRKFAVAGQALRHVQSRWGFTHGTLYDELCSLDDEAWAFPSMEREMYARE